MDAASLSYNTVRNSVYNLLALIVPIVFAFFVTPILVHRLGVQNYGLYTVINVVISFLTIFDFGLTWTIIKTVAKYFEMEDLNRLYEFINSAIVIYIGLGLASLVIIAGIAPELAKLLKLQVAPQTTWLLMLSALTFLITGFRSAFGAVLNGLQRYDLPTKVLLVNTLLVNTGLVAAALAHRGVITLIIIQLGGVLLLACGYYMYVRQLLPQWRWRFRLHPALIREEAKFGGFVFISQVAQLALYQLDKLILSAMLGPAVVPFYSVPGSVAQKMQDGSSSLTNVFFPLASQLDTAQESERLQKIYQRGMRVLLFLVSGVFVVTLFFANKILYYWISPEFAAKSTQILIILACTYYLIGLFVMLNNFILGLGKSKQSAFLTTAMGALDIVLLFVLIPKFGLIGAAWAYLLSVLPILWFFIYAEKRYLHFTGSIKFYLKQLMKIGVVAALAVAVAKFTYYPLISSLPTLLLWIAVTLAIYLGAYYAFGFFAEEDKILVKEIIKRKI